MRCHVCGAEMRETKTDLPFKLTERSIVVVREVPAIQCSGCREYMLSDKVMEGLMNCFLPQTRTRIWKSFDLLRKAGLEMQENTPEKRRLIKSAVKQRNILWTYHVFMRMQDRSIPRSSILDSADTF